MGADLPRVYKQHRMNHCKNCGVSLDAAYCPQCGQKDVDLQRPFLVLLRDILYETFDVDGRAARTVGTMVFHPGVITARFLAGHRRQYTPPVRLYLVFSVLFFFVVGWVVRQGILFEVNADSAGEVRVLTRDLPTLMIIFLPVFALLLKAAYRQRLYFDHLIHSLHLHTAAYVVLALLLPLERAANEHWFWLAVHLALFVYFFAYLMVSFRRVYGANWLLTSVKTLAVFVAYVWVLAVTLELVSDLTWFADG